MSNQNNNQKDEVIEEEIKKGILKIKDDKVIYPNGKSYNFKDPEEKVRNESQRYESSTIRGKSIVIKK